MEPAYRGYQKDQAELTQRIDELPLEGWKAHDEGYARAKWERKVIEAHQMIMGKQGASKKNYLAEHGDETLKKSPKTPIEELSNLWHRSIAQRLEKHMDIEPPSHARSRGYDRDGYLTWLQQYAKIKLEQGIVFKQAREMGRTAIAHILEHDRSQCGDRNRAKAKDQWGRGPDSRSARDTDMQAGKGWGSTSTYQQANIGWGSQPTDQHVHQHAGRDNRKTRTTSASSGLNRDWNPHEQSGGSDRNRYS